MTLSPADAEHWGEIWTCGFGQPTDKDPEFILEALRQAYREKLPVGVDTEFTTDDINRTGLAGARVHVASLGIPAGPERHDRAKVARRVVISVRALCAFKLWFASSAKKLFYSAPTDLHALAVAGIEVGGWEDLLPLSRYLAPDHKDHSLKYHITHTLGYRGEGEYRDNFFRFKPSAKTGLPTKAREPIRLAEIVPEHVLFEQFCRYAALDAKATVELGMKWAKEHGL